MNVIFAAGVIAAPHAGKSALPAPVAAAIVALVVAAVIVFILKGIARVLTPKKPASRSASPYAPATSKRGG